MKKRASRPPRFVAVDNRAVDTIHSVLAVGLLTILARAKDGDDVTVEGISKARKEGREALSGAMRALVQDGYVVKLKIQLQDGIWNEDEGKWEIRAGGWITEFNADTIPFTREDVAEMLAETENARAIRVEPEWLDPRDEADTAPPAKPKKKARLVRKSQPKQDPEPTQHDRPTETRNSVATRENEASSQVAPTDGFPAAGEPTAGEPTAGNAAALYRNKTSLQDSLSSHSSSDPDVTAERETSATPEDKISSAPAGALPAPRAEQHSEPVPAAAMDVVSAYASAAVAAGVPPVGRTLARIQADATELIRAGRDPKRLAELAAELPARGWGDLVMHANRNPDPQGAPAGPSRAELIKACPVCDEYGQITERTDDGRLTARNCRHEAVASAAA